MTRATARAEEAGPASIPWVVLACVLQSLLIAIRLVSVWRGPSRFWACALPAYLTRPSAIAELLAALLPISLIAWIGRRSSPAGAGASSRTTATSRRGRWLFALAPFLVLALPDCTGFIGDYLFRQGAILAGSYPASFPQSLPLDRFVQGAIVPALGAQRLEGTLPGARWMGLTACVVLTILVARRGTSFGTNGPWRSAAWASLVLGGYVCVFTGLARDVVESLPLIVLLLIALIDRLEQRTRPSPTPELALAALLLLHRSAPCLVPAYVVASASQLRDVRAGARGNGRWLAGVIVLALTVVVMAPRFVTLLLTFDLPRHASWTSVAGAIPPPIADPRSLWDLLNALLMLAPLAATAWLGLVGSVSGRERRFLLSASVGWFVLVLFARPQQGAFRDYDVYAGAALTLAFVSVLGLERVAGRGRGVDKALVALSFISTLQAGLGLLLVAHDAAATDAHVRHGLAIADPRLQGASAGMNEYLGQNAERRGQWREAARAYAEAADLAPSPLRLTRAGRAAAYAGDWSASASRFAELIARDSASAIGWSGYAGARRELGNGRTDSLAEARLLELCRVPARRQIALGFLAYAPVLDGAGVLRAKLAGVR